MFEDFEGFAIGCIGVLAGLAVLLIVGMSCLWIGGSFISWVVTSEEKVCTIKAKENLWSGDRTVMTVDTTCGHMEIASSEPSIYTYLEVGETYNLQVTGPPVPVITIMEAERV